MLLVFTSVWRIHKSSLHETTEIAWSLREAKLCAWKVMRCFLKYFAASKLKWPHSDTNRLPWWPVKHISFSSPWRLPVFCTDTVAAMPHTHTPIMDRLLSLPMPMCLSPCHCRQTDTSSRCWPPAGKPCGQGRSGRGGMGREDPGSASVHPNTFPLAPFYLWKSTCRHYIAFHYLNMKESPLVGTQWYRMKHRHKSCLVLT